MKSLKRLAARGIVWILFNGLFLTAIYYGFYKGVKGAENVAMVFAWINIVISFFFLSSDCVSKMVEKNISRSVPKYLNITFDMFIVVVLAFGGATITAVFWFIQLILQEGLFDEIEEQSNLPEAKP